MTREPRACREIEPDLIAVATAEAPPAAARRVERHVAACASCRSELARYQTVDGLVTVYRDTSAPEADPTLARAQLESRLADLRRRIMRYGVFDSSLGPIAIGISEYGVSMVEYVRRAERTGGRLTRRVDEEAVEDPSRTEALFRELADYLDGRRTRLDWSLDLRRARSDFQRRVLEATARLPYGAVTSYAGIAREIGAPRATRAVAQALRHNPLPIVVPCHRVIGSSGDLTGYAGTRIGLKRDLLAVEGIPTVAGRGDYHVERRAVYYKHLDDVEYCLPTCGTILQQPLGEFTIYGSRARAEAVGLQPCSSCRPDLHPLPA
jgi:methylated-DNA-[protein]-cysteine S-methyltransferase